MVLYTPRLPLQVSYYIGHTTRFWKEELPNILKTCSVPYVVVRVKKLNCRKYIPFYFRFTRILASIQIYLVCIYVYHVELQDWFGAVKAAVRGRTVAIEAV